MLNVVNTAKKLGYLTIPEDTMIDIDRIKNLNPEQVVIITTGSQGEPMSALARIAASTHKKVMITEGDLVIISANPIPGKKSSFIRLLMTCLSKAPM